MQINEVGRALTMEANALHYIAPSAVHDVAYHCIHAHESYSNRDTQT